MDHPPGQTDTTPAAQDPRGKLTGFWALIVTQFQGALSDNALKWLVKPEVRGRVIGVGVRFGLDVAGVGAQRTRLDAPSTTG
jgi:hypothetical protein